MYCIQCGVKLADTEKKCPLCGVVVYHPDLQVPSVDPLYPNKKLPERHTGSKVINGAVIILFLIPLMVCFFADWLIDEQIGWFGYVAGALTVAYVMFALPRWFEKPNPVIFVPCSFAALALYVYYIALATNGKWFFCFALPIIGGLTLISSALVSLLTYLKKGQLYIVGGAWMALGAWTLSIELLLCKVFTLQFIGWSIYPLVVCMILGGLLIYFGINRSAREVMERKLFF